MLVSDSTCPAPFPLKGVPRVLHYGLLFEVAHKGGKWKWDKHWFHSFNISVCPPWDFTTQNPQEGIFWPPPPKLADLLPRVSERDICYDYTCHDHDGTGDDHFNYFGGENVTIDHM
jgi:hypothetical protein